MRNYVIGIAVVAVLALGGWYFFYQTDEVTEGTTPAPVATTTDQAGTSTPETFTLAEVATHDERTDCWLVISGGVYDVTDFIPNHPGRDAILQGCGKDATTFFETRPMGSETPHSANARLLLADFYIGDLE
jgi:cytochrome b involved in lipid metabolism